MSATQPKPKFPDSFAGLVEAGYVYDSTTRCRGCGEKILFYITPVKKKRIPINADGRAAHFSTCPDADKFRRKK